VEGIPAYQFEVAGSGRYCAMRGFMVFSPQTSGGQIKKRELGRKCETYEVEDRFM
jgi:hypothetical protein